MKTRSFFTTLKHPYYIYSLNYRQSSSGIRVLHYLCHALNQMGEEAYVTGTVINPKLHTPTLTPEIQERHRTIGLKPISVYPEVIYGNPMNASVIARYILNRPGHLGGDEKFHSDELLFVYLRDFLPEGMEARTLFIPPVDTSIFNNLNNPFDKERSGACYYAHKYLTKGGKLTDVAERATDLTLKIPRTAQELATILRRSEVLYCYEPSSMSWEAMLCGCPVVFVPTDYVKELPHGEIIGDNGATIGLDPAEFERARATVGNVPLCYSKLEEQAWGQIEDFVKVTQAVAEARYQEVKPLSNLMTSIGYYLQKSANFAGETSLISTLNLLLSVVICSIDDERFARVARTYRDLLATIPHEIIRIDDASSLCEGYNRGIARSKGEYLILSHDDIEIWTPDFGQRLLQHLNRCDVVGVAGTDLLVDTSSHRSFIDWSAAGPGHVFGRIVTPTDNRYTVTLFGVPAVLVEGMQALDGAFIAMRRQVAEALRFDDETFDGFHFYDLDFTYRAFQSGFRVGVFNDIVIVHHSAGSFGEQWIKYYKRFYSKFEGIVPKARPLDWHPSFVVCEKSDEALAFCSGLIEKLSSVTTVSSKAPTEGRNDEVSDLTAYRRWCERRQVGEGWAEIVAERMVKRWRTQPTFHLVVWCEPAQQAALADMIDSVGQQLYDRWGLSVLAPFDCPDDSFVALPNLEWVKIEADADAALRNVLEASALDWFVLLEPGDRLASHALLKIADYINRYPTWRFIYVDEDQIDVRSERRDPVFRPEFDLELLLATHYLGDCCLMHRDSVLGGGALPYLPGLTTFQAALGVFERYGRPAIGHIADALYHRALIRSPVADAEAIARARRRLVEDHFARRGVAASVEEGLLPGTWRVVHHHSTRPKISIIILARDVLDLLDRCLRRLLGETVYPDYEVLVVDCGSEVDDTLDLYAELEARYPQRFRVIPAQGPFSVSAYRNQGARQTQGELLVFLSASALVIQPQWLERLLNHALRDEVGIVGARMVTPDRANPFVHGTAQALGMRGIAGPLFAGLSLKAPGPFGRAQVDQAVSAVSADCLAIRREVFEVLEGFGEEFTVAHADTDLCLRAAERGYRAVWTPFANLAWLGEYPLATGFDHEKLHEHGRADADRMFERWLPKLAADPVYNPNLSLAEPNRIEVDLAPGWDTHFHDRPRLLGFPVDESGCGLYRVYAPLWLLEHQARAECTLVKPGARLPELAELERLAPDTVFYQTTLSDIQLEAMRRYRRFHRSFKVFDLDDLKHDVPDANSLKERLMRDMKHRHRLALRECDRLTVSTEPLAEACRKWIGDIRVVPNRLERARWCHLQNRRRIGPKPRVGWAGAQQHHGDLAFIADVVKQTHDEVEWMFFGMCLEELRPYVKEIHDWVHLNDYPAKLASLDLDLAVAPLEYHSFNEAKSNLRVLEHGILGRPMVCTDIYPYRNVPVKRVPNETSAWVEAIRERVHDLDAAEREGDALRAWVLEHYILDDHTDDWLSALRP